MKPNQLFIFIFSMAVLFLSACDESGKTADSGTNLPHSVKNETPAVDYKDSLRIHLRNFLKDEQKPEEVFRIPFAKKTLKTTSGVKIFFNPEIFDTAGEIISSKDTVTLLFKDFYTQKDFILNHLQTMSDEGMLISGGMFFIDLKHNDKSLKIKDSAFLKVKFPVKNKSEMNLYYKNREDSIWFNSGQKLQAKKEYKVTRKWMSKALAIEMIEEIAIDEDGNIIEDPEREPPKAGWTPKDTANSEWVKSRQYVGSYYNLQLKKLGWINIDRFYEVKNKTNLYIQIEQPETFKFVQSYLVFKSMNSVLEFMADSSYRNQLMNMPLGEKVKLISLYADVGNLYYAENDLVITENKLIVVNLKKISKKDFEAKMNSL